MTNGNTDTTDSRRPVAVSSTSSLDSSSSTPEASASSVRFHANSGESQPGELHSIQSDALWNIPEADVVSSGVSPLLSSAVVAPQTAASFGPHTLAIMPTLNTAPAAAVAPAPVPNSNTVAEFLFQLTKMLTDDNREVIEWVNGRIEVHNPHKLASDVLHKYFRHSKFASFQRQLNYFGFRKLAGKGKMAPCSYVNDATTEDLSSILLMKRKTGTSQGTRDKHANRKRERSSSTSSVKGSNKSASESVNPILAGILERQQSSTTQGNQDGNATAAKVAVGKGVKHHLNGYLKQGANVPTSNDYKALAKAAAGKGVRHNFAMPNTTKDASTGAATAALESASMTFPEPTPQLGNLDIQASLSELTNNYRNSLNDSCGGTENDEDGLRNFSFSDANGLLSRDSSLLNLAMPSWMDSVEPTPVSELRNSVMPFVDFPNPQVDPRANNQGNPDVDPQENDTKSRQG